MTPKAEQSGVAFDQRIAKFAVRGLSKTPLTPNQVTLFSICLGLAVAWMFTQGGAMAHAAGALFIVTVWLDHVDGELARATGRTSEFGHYFDHCAAMTNYVAMFVGAGIGARMGFLDWNAIYLGIAAGASIVLIMSIRMYAEGRFGRDAMKQSPKAGFEVEDTLYIVGPVTWLGLMEYFIVLAGIGAPIFLLYVIWDFFRKDRERGRA